MDLTIGLIKEKAKNRKIYIWGGWARGALIEEWLTKNGLCIEGYIDSKKVGNFNNKEIFPLQDILQREDVFIIVSLIYHETVKVTLDQFNMVMYEDYIYMGNTVTITDCFGYHDIMGNEIKGYLFNNNVQMAIKSKLEVGKGIVLCEKKQIKIIGFSQIVIGDCTKLGDCIKIECLNKSRIEIGKGVQIGNNVKLICECNSSVIIEDNVRIEDNTTILCKENSIIEIAAFTKIDNNVLIECTRNSTINLNKNVHLCMYSRMYSWRNGYIVIGEKTSLGQYLDLRSGTGTRFTCGRDCMISYRVRMRSHNGHTIIDVRNKEVYNTKKNCTLGNHVWVGTGSLLMPGTKVGDGSVIGANSFLNGEFGKRVLIVGNPARILRDEIDWDRRENASYEEWEEEVF